MCSQNKGKFEKAQKLRAGTPESDCGSEQPLLVILRLSWEEGTKVSQIRGSEDPCHGGRNRGKVGRKEMSWPISGTLG